MEQPKIKEVYLTRVINAARELVYRVWTEPEHLAQWWGPRGFSAPVCEADVRPGGNIRIHMDHPAFPDHWMTGTFHEVVAPEKLVFSFKAFVNQDGIAMLEGVNSITFEEEHGNTKLTVHAAITKAAPGMEMALAGMNQGWSESLDKMEEYIACF